MKYTLIFITINSFYFSELVIPIAGMKEVPMWRIFIGSSLGIFPQTPLEMNLVSILILIF